MEIPGLTRAEYLIKRFPQDCSSTIPLIEKAMQRAQGYHNTRQVIRFQVVKAVALKCAGRLNEAVDVLEEALRLAEPLGFMRTFLDRGPIMAELLDALLQRCPGNAYGRRLLGAFESKTTSIPQETAAESRSMELTAREIDVLIMIAERLSNKEIAERLFISAETVKKHTTNIYRKLDVHGRRQAIAAAH